MTGAGRRNATLPTRYVRDAASPDSSGALQLRPGGKRVAPGLALRALPGTRSRWSLARRLGSALHAVVGYGRTSPPDAFGRFRSRWSLARRLGSALHAAVGYGKASPPERRWEVPLPASGALVVYWGTLRFMDVYAVLIRTFSFATAGETRLRVRIHKKTYGKTYAVNHPRNKERALDFDGYVVKNLDTLENIEKNIPLFSRDSSRRPL